MKSDAIIITETNVPNEENLSYFGNGNETHLIYNFSLLHYLSTPTLVEIVHIKTWMMSMPPAREGRSYFNFIASHDGVGLRPTEGLLNEKERKLMLKTLKKFGATITSRMNVDKKESPYEANISLYDAFKGTFKSSNNKYQVNRMLSAHTILLA